MWMRALLVMIAVLVGAQATGLSEAIEGTCAEPCDEDNDRGICPPTCALCTCAQRVVEPVVTLLDALPAGVVVADIRRPREADAGRASEGFAGEIAHVPIGPGSSHAPSPLLYVG